MSDSTDDPNELALLGRLQVLKNCGVSKARFNDQGALTFVEFGVLDPIVVADDETSDPTKPMREAAMRLVQARGAQSAKVVGS